ncbi:MAG TPA: DNA mismatch repair endonuclease MutH [Polyangiaceae bacterium]|nr:DNA mismatch repair endonuclease MutH [Polyangiaceae bacterium]
MSRIPTPQTEAELLERAERLAGDSLSGVAERLGHAVPANLNHHKGWVGHLIERALGASAGSRDAPDFEALGVELKTLPVDAAGRPFESTFVATILLSELTELEWEQSRPCRKLTRVLWVPVQGDRRIPLNQRRIGTPFIWSPDADEGSALRFDWDELAGLVARRGVEAVTGHVGQFLQIRPKARDASVRFLGSDNDGAPLRTLPRGFYLRPVFTHRIVRHRFGL